MKTLTAAGRRLEFEWFTPASARLAPEAPVLVLLHEGLGSLAMWKDFPALLAQACGCRVLAYSRQGYGRSERLERARTVDYMHAEALDVLPEVLRRLDIVNPVLVGHSDGASIALIHAGTVPHQIRGLVLLAPHEFVEDLTVASIAEAKTAYQTTDLRAKLARYHDDPDHTFRGWNDIWLHPDFRHWNIEEFLPRITCPVLAIQGERDEYGTMAQIDSIVRHVPHTAMLALSGCGHSPHRDRTDAVVRAIAHFVRGV